LNQLSRSIVGAFTVAEMEARKIRHDSTELWTRAIQPALWLAVFGVALNTIRGIAPGGYSYIQFIAPGVLAQSVLFISIFYGITVVWEKDVGLLTKLLSSPAPRASIIVGKALAAGIRGIFEAIVIFSLTLIMGVNLRFDLVDVLSVFLVVVLFAMCFAGLSMLLASYLKAREKMMGVGQAITMPLFFASNAIYPISLMPRWLQLVSFANPLSYVVDAMRAMMLTGDYSGLPADMLALVIATLIFLTAASLAVRRLVE
jgi:ABC-2 type transport system permease protein